VSDPFRLKEMMAAIEKQISHHTSHFVLTAEMMTKLFIIDRNISKSLQ